MYAKKLICPQCEAEYPLDNLYECTKCGYSLEVNYDYSKVNVPLLSDSLRKGSTLWDFRQLLPVRDEKNVVTLGEGGTPLISSIRIGPQMGVRLHFKDETRNPTGAFKDRPNTVGISMARDLGLNAVAIASTGNGGGSLAAYAAKAGVPCYVFIPESTSDGKVSQAIAHGATLVKVKGDYSCSYRLALEACRKFGWANLTSTYLNPYTMEGDKTIAYELYAQMDGEVPDWIVVPLGAGAMLSGIYKGYMELQRFGMVKKLPKMIGVQAKGCSPITGAFEAGLNEVSAFENPDTVAGGICDPLTGYPQDGTRTLRAIRTSGGAGVSVDDPEIMNSLYQLARQEAIFCEPSSAASLTAVNALLDKGVIYTGDSIVCIITGHGLKDAHVIQERERRPVIPAELNEFQKAYNITI